MKKSLTFKIIMIITLVIIAIISFNYSKSLKGVSISEKQEKSAGGTYDLYITGVQLKHNPEEFYDYYSDIYVDNSPYICIFKQGTDEMHQCDIKATWENMISEDTLKVQVDDLDATYYYRLFVYDMCFDDYYEPVEMMGEGYEYYSGIRLDTYKDTEMESLVAYISYDREIMGSKNLWCDGKMYSNARPTIYQFWTDNGYTATQRPPSLKIYNGTYENGEYHIDLNTERIYGNSSGSYTYMSTNWNLTTLNEVVVYETYDNIDNYICGISNLNYFDNNFATANKVTINGITYCAYRFTIKGNSNYTYFYFYNTYDANTSNLKNYTISNVWEDEENQDGKRPNSVSVGIYYNNKFVTNVTLLKDDNWTGTVKLPEKNYAGDVINYEFRETVNDYTSEVDVNGKSINITNTHTPEKINLTVKNTWKDLVGDSPEKVEVNLLRNGEIIDRAELTADNDWTYTFEADKYYNGSVAKYGVQERAIEGFDLEVKGNQTSGFELINTQTGEFRKVKIMLESVCGSGTVTGSEEIIYGSDSSPNGIVITADEDYYIDYIKVNGEKIPLEEKLTSYVMDQFEDLEEDVNISVCFKRFDGKVLGVQFLGNIVNNPNTKVGIFTTTLMIGLIATGALVVQGLNKNSFRKQRFNLAITSAVVIISMISLVSVISVNNKYKVENQVGEKALGADETYLYIVGYVLTDARIKVTGNNGVEYIFDSSSDNLVYSNNIYKIALPKNDTYSVDIEAVYCEGKKYENVYHNFVTITDGPGFEVASYTSYGVGDYYCNDSYQYMIEISNNWDDYNNRYNTRPTYISMELKYYNDLSSYYGYDEDFMSSIICDALPGNAWSCYDYNESSDYTLSFHDPNGIYGYLYEKMEYENTMNFDTTEVEYVCQGELLDDGTCKIPIYQSMFSYGYCDDYYMDCYGGDYYKTTISITNTLSHKAPTPETHNKFTIEKIWNDNDNQDGKRPNKVFYQVDTGNSLYNTNLYVYGNDWTGFFWVNKNVDIDDLTVTEGSVNGYTETDKVVDLDAKKITFTNTHELEETEVKVTTSWENLGPDDIQPETVIINLIADGEIVDNVEVTAVGGWTYTFTGLPKYENGRLIAYTVSERLKDGYFVEITGDAATGYTVTNVKTDETRTVQVLAEVKCGEGTITGSEELLYGANSTPNAIVAKGAENYAIDYVMINDDKREMDDLTTKYVFDRFLNVTSDQTVQVCFVDAEQQLTEINKDKEPEQPEKEENKDPVNPNTGDFIKIISVIVVLSLIVVVILITNYKKVKRVD